MYWKHVLVVTIVCSGLIFRELLPSLTDVVSRCQPDRETKSACAAATDRPTSFKRPHDVYKTDERRFSAGEANV